MIITPDFFHLSGKEDTQTVTEVGILYVWSFGPMEFNYIPESEMYLKFTWKGGIFLTSAII